MEKFKVTGMSCAACSARVEQAVSALDGVTSCSVNLLTGDMGVEGSASPEQIVSAVRAAGYDASPRSALGARAQSPQSDPLADRTSPLLLCRLIVSIVLLALLMLLSMGHMIGLPLPAFLADSPLAQGLSQLLLAGAVMVINQSFFISGTKAFFRLSPNMDTLVAMGSAAAFGYSTYALYQMIAAARVGDSALAAHYLHSFYFESAAMIVTLITVGKLLEARAKGKTTDALKGLMKLSPRSATLLRDGKEITLPVEQVKIGDIFLVRPGETIPVDGTVLDGESAVNESALTGESIPTDKAPGAGVSAGTVNQSGFLKCRADRVGEDTTLAQIIETVREAAATKAPIAKMADKVSSVFVPAVIGIGAVTVAAWLFAGQSVGYALARGISVLVISCPCALGLATPVAIMVGSGVGAKNGILFKTAASLEQAGRIHTVMLDKTGTVTQGKPRVTDIFPCEGITEHRLLTAAFALEAKSEHPLSHAICEEARNRGIAQTDLQAFRIFPGNGLEGKDGTLLLRGGNLPFIDSIALIPDRIREAADRLSEEGKTPLFFSENGTLLGIIAVADTIKPDAVEAIRALKQMGIRVVMLTGDNARTANAIGAQVGVDEVLAEILPSGKEAAIRTLAENGRGVAMVGDGINDAPALTSADLGIAIGAGTDVAIDAADVVLMKSRMMDIPAAIRLGRKALKNIRENLFWAFFYNVIGIPLAAGVFIPLFGLELNPMFGAAAMSLSSFCVVTNALRLNLVKLYPSALAASENAAERKTVTLQVEGMMCAHCERRVQEALLAVRGVDKALASHKDGTVTVSATEDTEQSALKKAIEDAGYRVV